MNDISTYKSRLQEEKARLEGELQTVGRRNPSNPNDWEAVPPETGREPDPNDRADQMRFYNENNAILTDLENRYNDVKEALARIEDGSFGTCAVGGEPIEDERLDADAAARTCLEHVNA